MYGLKRIVLAAAILGFAAGAAWAWELDESPAEAEAWGFRPADGATVTLTPPPFTWRPEDNAAEYHLQVAASPDFTQSAYEIPHTPWPAHCPSRTLGPGTYFWRYAAIDKGGQRSAWSTIRRFTIDANAVPFPQPSIEELAKRIPEAHPRVLFRPEEVVRFKELAAGPLSETWKDILEKGDRLLERPPDTSEPPKYPEDVKFKSEAWKKIWWGNRERAIAVTDGAATLAFSYRLSGEDRYGQSARNLMMAFCEWDPKGSTNYRYNDEAAMPLLYYPSRAYTWAYDVFTPEERERIRAVMAERGADCYAHLRRCKHLWYPYNSHSNRAWHWLGEVALAFWGEIPDAKEWLDYIMTIFYTCYPVWGEADGGWHEGTSYWNSYTVRFMYWAETSRFILGINPFEKPFYDNTGYWAMYTLPPGTKAGAFGDLAEGTTSSRIGTLMAQLAAGAGNPHWEWYAERHHVRRSGYFGFIQAAHAAQLSAQLSAQLPDDLPSSRVFPDTGLAVLNTSLLDGTQNIQVHFKSSPLGRKSHGYNSNNAFLLNMRGQRVLRQSGKRDIYGSPHHKAWMWETKSDNAILVNREGQIPHSAEAIGRITAFFTSTGLDVVAGEAGESYKHLDRWTRRILFFKPAAIVIHDVLEAPEPSTYQWLLHAEGAFEIKEGRATWEGPPGRIEVRFLTPGSLKVTQTDRFDPPPYAWAKFDLGEWHLTAETIEKSAQRQFVTVIVLDAAAVESHLEEKASGYALRMTLPQGEATVNLSPDGFSVHGLGIDREF